MNFDVNYQNAPLILDVQGLVKRYGSRTVVNGVSFNVHEGEIVGLLGLNGAGKTTSFRMTCGLIPAVQGTVILNGINVSEWPMYRRAREGKMGYLPQDRSTFGSLSTEQNLYIMAEQLGMPHAEQKTRCNQLMNEFRLEKVRHSKVGNGGTGGLSGGERRRLEFARALLSDPKILLLDEPFANVDPPTVIEIQEVILNLSKNGIAFLITDHQVPEILKIAHRIYVIDQGEVLCSGTAEEVLANEEAQRRYFCGDKSDSNDRAAQAASIIQKRKGVQNGGKGNLDQSKTSSSENNSPETLNDSTVQESKKDLFQSNTTTSECVDSERSLSRKRSSDATSDTDSNSLNDTESRRHLSLHRRENEQVTPSVFKDKVNPHPKKGFLEKIYSVFRKKR